MDDSVIRSMLKWPDVPDVFGWLRLDRRGNWRIRRYGEGESLVFEPIGNPAFREFIGRNYASDEHGRWFFQNGPQRVFVGLDFTPLVFRIDGAELVDQCGRRSGPVDGVWLDEEGSAVLRCSRGAGGLDDRDLMTLADDLAKGVFKLGASSVPVGKVLRSKMEAQFGFVLEPGPSD